MRCLTILILFLGIEAYGQSCEAEKGIFDYISCSLEKDIHQLLEIDKGSIPKSKIYISSDFIKSEEDIKSGTNITTLTFEDLGVPKKYCNYLLFHSELTDGVLKVEVFFKRDEFLNINHYSEYEEWRRQNIGLRYTFKVDKDNCPMLTSKKAIGYD